MRKTSNSWKAWTKMHHIAREIERLLALGISDVSILRARTFQTFRPLVMSQTEPMIFTRNVRGGSRQPLPLEMQYKRLWWTIGKCMVEMGLMSDEDMKTGTMPGDEIPAPDEPMPEPTPSETKTENAVEYFMRRVLEIREWCLRKAEVGPALDHLAMRPIKDGVAGILAGISADAMLATMAMHWPEDAKRDAGIPRVDFRAESDPVGEGYHYMMGYILKLAKARIPIMLIGPAGTGKSFILRQLAELLELPFAECPMTAGATPSWLLGAETMKGYKTRENCERYAHGGVFNYEEIDASDPNMLLVLNQMLAQDSFFNPMSGETLERSSEWIPTSCANTMGLGANREFTGRERLDAATIDRWRMGRVFIDFDAEVAREIVRRMTTGTEYEINLNV